MPGMTPPTEGVITIRTDQIHHRYTIWEAANKRWYWNEIVNGHVVQSGNYASKRSARRAVLKFIKDRGMFVTDETTT